MNFINKFRISVLVLFFIFITGLPAFSQDSALYEGYVQPEVNFVSAKVVEILSEEKNEALSDSFQGEQLTQIVKVLILKGTHQGKTIEIENHLSSNPVYDIRVKPGMRIILTEERFEDETNFYITDIERFPVLLMVTGLFLSLLLLIGGQKGLNSIFSLCVTAGLIFLILIPAILAGYPIILTAVIVALISTIITMFIVGGVNLKSVSASIGTIISVAIAGFTSMLVIKFAPLNGFQDQESIMLYMNRTDLDFTEILTAAIIIGALGAVMDVGMSVASSISELKKVNPNLTVNDLFKSGLNVGRDIMGTMTNTLILAYLGGAFSLVLLASKAPIAKLINLNSIATEITAAITGSIGIVLCVPITAAVAGYLIGRPDKTQQMNQEVTEEEMCEKV